MEGNGLENSSKKSEEQEKLGFKERSKSFGQRFKKRLPRFTIVSLIGFGINTLAVFLTEIIMNKYWPHMANRSISIGEIDLFSYSIIGFIALTLGIGAATTSNF